MLKFANVDVITGVRITLIGKERGLLSEHTTSSIDECPVLPTFGDYLSLFLLIR